MTKPNAKEVEMANGTVDDGLGRTTQPDEYEELKAELARSLAIYRSEILRGAEEAVKQNTLLTKEGLNDYGLVFNTAIKNALNSIDLYAAGLEK